MTLHEDHNQGVRFVLTSEDAGFTMNSDESNRREMLAERLNVLANNVFNPNKEIPFGLSSSAFSQTEEHYTAVMDGHIERTTPHTSPSIMDSSYNTILRNNTVIPNCVNNTTPSPSQQNVHVVECFDKHKSRQAPEASNSDRPHLVRKDVLTNGSLQKIYKESMAIQDMTTPVIYREQVTCMMCHRPVCCDMDGFSSKYCRRHQYLTE